MPGGVQYSPEVVAELLERIADGLSLRRVCAMEGMPSTESWRRWMREHEDLRGQYARARADRASARADEIIDIADDRDLPVEDRKVMIDARKWEASKLDRANYGDRQAVEHTFPEMSEAERVARIKALLAAAEPDEQS